MAITDKEEGVWELDQVYNKINQGGIWSYSVPGGDPVQLFMWGQDHNGKLGLNETTGNLSSPTQVPGKWSTRCGPYSQSDGCVVAVKTDGTLWSWGYDGYGQSGHNDTVYRSSPMQIGTDTTWAQGTTGYRFSMGVKTDGTLWAWGLNDYGNLGQNANIGDPGNRSSPIQVGTDTTWNKAMGCFYSVAAFKTDGTLWRWGSNTYGSLGLNGAGPGPTGSRSSPTQIPGDWNPDAVHVLGGPRSFAGVKTDGTLWVWGWNQSGDLGLNEGGTTPQGGTYYSSPTQMGTDSNWAQVSAGPGGGLATKTDGTLWGWGANNSGKLGLNSANPDRRSSPTQVGTDTNWSTDVGAVQQGRGALKTDGTLWVWGGNSSTGTLGLNQGPGQSSGYSSPTQIPGTWSQIQYSSSYNVMALK